MIRFAKSPTPAALTQWQATPGATWASVSSRTLWPELLHDQAAVCAYCQRRIPTRDDRMKVEHWAPQSSGQGSLQWTNLLGVCLGDETAETGAVRGERHCDTARGNAALLLHPVEGCGPSPLDELVYDHLGTCSPRPGAPSGVAADIEALRLNARRLTRARQAVLDALKARLERQGWSPRALKEEYRALEHHPGTRRPEHAEFLRYRLRKMAAKRGITL